MRLQTGCRAADVVEKCVQSPSLYRLRGALRDGVCALPIVAAIKGDEDFAGSDVSEGPVESRRLSPDAEPEDINWCSDILELAPTPLPYDRMTSVRPDGQRRTDLRGTDLGVRPNA